MSHDYDDEMGRGHDYDQISSGNEVFYYDGLNARNDHDESHDYVGTDEGYYATAIGGSYDNDKTAKCYYYKANGGYDYDTIRSHDKSRKDRSLSNEAQPCPITHSRVLPLAK